MYRIDSKTKGGRLVRRRSVHHVRAQLGGRFLVPHASRQRSFPDTRARTFERSILAHQTVSLVGKSRIIICTRVQYVRRTYYGITMYVLLIVFTVRRFGRYCWSRWFSPVQYYTYWSIRPTVIPKASPCSTGNACGGPLRCFYNRVVIIISRLYYVYKRLRFFRRQSIYALMPWLKLCVCT